MHEIPSRFRAQFTDRFINYVRGTGEMMIQIEMDFNSRLDVTRLEKALDVTLDAEPILGCRLVERWWRPQWERLGKNEREVLIITEDTAVYEKFKHASINTYEGPQLKACLLHSAQGDRLLMKVAHEVADASGVRQIACIASSIYSRLAHEPQYHPVPNVNGDRSTWQVLRHVPWHAYPTIVYNYFRLYMIPVCFPIVTAQLPIVEDNDRTLQFTSRDIPVDMSKRMIEYGRQRNGTLNDIILASYFHAIAAASNWNRRSQLRLRVTVDLRRFKPDSNGNGICNLSGMEVIDLGTDLNDDFNHTLKRISSFMHRRKATWIGINDYAVLAPTTVFLPHEVMRKVIHFGVQSSIKVKQAPYVFTNMGAIEPGEVTFDVPPIEARFLPPVNYPPHIIFCFSSYKGSLNVAAGTWPCSREHVDRCLDGMVKILTSLTSGVDAA